MQVDITNTIKERLLNDGLSLLNVLMKEKKAIIPGTSW